MGEGAGLVVGVILCNGRIASADELASPALVHYGHFTTMQARDGAVRGLDLHLQRLREATVALFGRELEEARIRHDLRAALAAFASGDATLRASVFAADFDLRAPARTGRTDLLVSVTPPREAAQAPLCLKSYPFVRELPQFKHAGTFALFHHRRLARQAGYDDALFVDTAGRLAEGPFWNLGLWDGGRLIWPQGPALRGTRERLLQAGLQALGIAQLVRPVTLDELGGGVAAFTCNASGQQSVAIVDGHRLAEAPQLADLLQQALRTQPWQPI